jgi:Peptidase family M23
MSRRLRYFLFGLVIACPTLPAFTTVERGVSAYPGTIARWTGTGTTRCAMKGRVWSALHGNCYYPIDILQKPGIVPVSRWISGRREYARIRVEPFDYGTEEVQLPDIPQAHPSPEDIRRAKGEDVLQSRIWHRPEGPAKFTLPLGPASRPFPKCKSFGVKRIYNGKPDPFPHMGMDCLTPEGSPVLAVADGRVVLTANLFFAGNAVFIDHGNGLISMYFHLAKIDVKEGEEVARGHILGTVGSTGRSTGPHLFFGVRWHDTRIDPASLFEEPEKISDVHAQAS